MRVFVTGASGFIGSAVVAELLAHGHEVAGLARSDAAAQAVGAAGATVLRGDLTDLDVLRAGAADSDGVIHLAFNHDFMAGGAGDFGSSVKADADALLAIADALEGSDRPFVSTGGVLGVTTPGQLATEADAPPADHPLRGRTNNLEAALAYSARGVRTSAIRLSPSVHGEGDKGFLPAIIAASRAAGEAGYVGDGSQHWPAVHRLDAARLYRLALEQAPAGSVLHGVADSGVRVGDIVAVVGARLDLPVVSLTPEQAGERYGFVGHAMGMDSPASSEITQQLLGWTPTGPGLLQDLEQGQYFA